MKQPTAVADLAGPFRLASLALATTSMPNALNDLVEDAHFIRPYRLEEFTRTPFGQPDLLQAAERLEAEAEAAREEDN